jgi:hypothetical protein
VQGVLVAAQEVSHRTLNPEPQTLNGKAASIEHAGWVCVRFGVEGLRFVRFGFQGLKFRVQGAGFEVRPVWVSGFRFRVQGLRFRVEGSGARV